MAMMLQHLGELLKKKEHSKEELTLFSRMTDALSSAYYYPMDI